MSFAKEPPPSCCIRRSCCIDGEEERRFDGVPHLCPRYRPPAYAMVQIYMRTESRDKLPRLPISSEHQEDDSFGEP